MLSSHVGNDPTPFAMVVRTKSSAPPTGPICAYHVMPLWLPVWLPLMCHLPLLFLLLQESLMALMAHFLLIFH